MIKDKKCGLLYLIISFQNSCKNSTFSNYPYRDIIVTFQNTPLELKYEKKKQSISQQAEICMVHSE